MNYGLMTHKYSIESDTKYKDVATILKKRFVDETYSLNYEIEYDNCR